MGYKEIMMDLEGIRQEVENAPQKELKHNLNKVSNKLLKCEREKVYGLCLSAVSVLGAVGGLVMAFAPSSTLKGIGLCLLGTGILGGVATYYKNKKTKKLVKL